MSIAFEQRVKDFELRLHQADRMIAALKLKVDALESLVIPRPKIKLPERKPKEWAQPTTP